jgi:HEPN domain-containing protein
MRKNQMNERIRELAEQTGWAEHIRYKPTRIEIEKFAELIVEECLLKINGAKIRNESYTELIGRIKEDFGVEE